MLAVRAGFFPKSVFVFVALESLVMLSFGAIRSRLSSKSKRRLVVAAFAAQGDFAAKKLYKPAQIIPPATKDKC